MIRGHQNNPRRNTDTPKQVAALLQARNGEAKHVEEDVWIAGNIVTLEHGRWAAMLDLSKDRPGADDFSWIGIVPKFAPDRTIERYLLSMPPLSEAPPNAEPLPGVQSRQGRSLLDEVEEAVEDTITAAIRWLE